jgi:hypothetical protein
MNWRRVSDIELIVIDMEQIWLGQPCRMTRMPHLTVADLIERRVPLSADEATSLALAAWRACAGAGDSAIAFDESLCLSSAGEVTCRAGAHERRAEGEGNATVAVAMLLRRLLQLDAPELDRRGRVPGALLVVLARTLRQIDLPPLTPDAFRDALERFATQDPSALAAVFWRAARMRPRRRGERGARTSRTLPVRHAERRSHGPSRAELRRWLRQAERDAFAARHPAALRSGRSLVAATVLGVAMLAGFLGLGAFVAPRTQPSGLTLDPSVPHIYVDTRVQTARVRHETRVPDTRLASTAAPRPAAHARPRRPISLPAGLAAPRQIASTQPRHRRQTARTVNLVNLPHATWAVVR